MTFSTKVNFADGSAWILSTVFGAGRGLRLPGLFAYLGQEIPYATNPEDPAVLKTLFN